MAYTVRTVDDLDTLKAIAHPLRMRLLGALRIDGPATASQLGRRLGESSGSTSYHLRQLERYGFVTDDEEQPSGRERRWRAVHDMTAFPTTLADVPGADDLLGVVRGRQIEVMQQGLAAWTEPSPGIGISDYALRLDPEDVLALNQEIDDVIGRYADRSGEREVTVHVLTLPRPA